jgi:hypothetical protein
MDHNSGMYTNIVSNSQTRLSTADNVTFLWLHFMTSSIENALSNVGAYALAIHKTF